jgi:3-isopropylmalate dehydrogenase
LIGGDGTGPEVVREGLKVLDTGREGFSTEFVDYDLGGARYLRTGEVLPDSVLEEMRSLDAIYLGAVGTPEVPPGILERGLLLRIRFELDQYVNLRPIRRYAGVRTLVPSHEYADIDMMVVRENSEGLYSGAGGVHRRGTRFEVATQESINTRYGVERCVRYAFDIASRPDRRGHATLIHKTNILTFAGDLWERTFREVAAADYPHLDLWYTHVDAACVYFLDSPERFDVIVTDNMFGDIVTDLGAMIQGGMGVAASGNINPAGTSMFEPIGGSAPDHTGKGTINPIAAIAAMGMLLDHLGEHDAAAKVDAGIRFAVPKMATMRAAEMGFTTAEVSDLVCRGAGWRDDEDP